MKAKTITVMLATTCLACGEKIEKEETATWKRGVGIWHPDCNPTPEQREKGRDAMKGVYQ